MKKSILIAGVLMAASMIQAEVLSWRVDIDGTPGNQTYATAQLFSTTERIADFQNIVGAGVTQLSEKINKYDNTWGVFTYDSNVSAGRDKFFFVKLYDSNGMVQWSSDLTAWSTLVSDGALVSGSTPSFPATTPWNAGIGVVPEPTSMALLAMGVSALLLRRKRVA